MPTTAADASDRNWELVWSDDFDKLDETKWTLVDTNVPTNNSQQDYLPSQASVQDGRLVLLSENISSRDLPYRSGQVISKPEWKHGRWEVRAKLPATRGMWPAIWLLPDVEKYPWPSGGEIDIMENRGNEPTLTSSAFHYGSQTPYKHDFVFDEHQARRNGELVDYTAGFHIYAAEWDERSVRYYVDGVNYFTVYDHDVNGFLSQRVTPMQLVLNTAIGGGFLPDPDDSTVWPQRFEIDWVRVYRATEHQARPALQNGGFDADGGSLAGWSTFGVDLRDNPNVVAAPGLGVDGSSALKMFGVFQGGTTYSGVAQGIDVAVGAPVRASLKTYIDAADSITGTANVVEMKIEFYRVFGGKFDSSDLVGVQKLVVADKDAENNKWRRHVLEAIAPAEAVEARVAIVFEQPALDAGAVIIDEVELTTGREPGE
ncbi:glycoside hydrolase family 16 protein [Posidoniimonas polymericola]|nr:glycoside hydrolase family 16 protein [Posidoniimonas polymericola]